MSEEVGTIKVECPDCGKRFRANRADMGKRAHCPCGGAILIREGQPSTDTAFSGAAHGQAMSRSERTPSLAASRTCSNHPGTTAVDRCAGCAEPFCSECLVEIQGQRYCGSCKVLTVRGRPSPQAGVIPCALAGSALQYAIFGLFCFGIILGPIAISKALKAKKEIEADPRLTGSGKANAALIIGIIVIVLWVLGLIAKASQISSTPDYTPYVP